MKISSRGALIGVINIILILIYIVVASLSWRIPEEYDAGLSPAMSGSSVLWFESALPILPAVLFVNIIMVTVSLKNRRIDDFTKTIFAFLPLAWTIAIIVDFWHH
jgi:hypothetical protein